MIQICMFNNSEFSLLLNMPKYICALAKPFYTWYNNLRLCVKTCT